MFVDRMCLGPSQDVCVRAPPRSSSASVRPRRSMSHGGRRCSSIAGAARRGITRTVEGRLRASSPRSSSAAVRPPRSMSHGGRRCSSIVGAVPRGHYSDRRWTAACELPAILIGRSPTTALDVPRGPSMFVDRRCGITRTVGRPQLGLAAPAARRCSRSRFVAFRARHWIRSSATRRAGRLRASSPRSSSVAVRPRPDVPRGSSMFVDRRCCAARHHSDRRSTAARTTSGGSSMFAAMVRGAWGRSSSCRSFCRDPPYQIESAPSRKRHGRAPRGAFS